MLPFTCFWASITKPWRKWIGNFVVCVRSSWNPKRRTLFSATERAGRTWKRILGYIFDFIMFRSRRYIFYCIVCSHILCPYIVWATITFTPSRIFKICLFLNLHLVYIHFLKTKPHSTEGPSRNFYLVRNYISCGMTFTPSCNKYVSTLTGICFTNIFLRTKPPSTEGTSRKMWTSTRS